MQECFRSLNCLGRLWGKIMMFAVHLVYVQVQLRRLQTVIELLSKVHLLWWTDELGSFNPLVTLYCQHPIWNEAFFAANDSIKYREYFRTGRLPNWDNRAFVPLVNGYIWLIMANVYYDSNLCSWAFWLNKLNISETSSRAVILLNKQAIVDLHLFTNREKLKLTKLLH